MTETSNIVVAGTGTDLEQQDAINKMLNGGLFLDRPQMRKLYKKLVKARTEALERQDAGLVPFGTETTDRFKIIVAQLAGALDRKGWAVMSISAPNLAYLNNTGICIGIVR